MYFCYYTIMYAIFMIAMIMDKNWALANDQNGISFLALGDWGKGGNEGNILYAATGTSVATETDDESGEFSKANQAQNTYTYQAPVAKAMSDWAAQADPKPSFLLSLGDNFYTNGVASTTDSLWESLWQEVYLRDYSNLNVSWYPVFGNHDYGYGLTGINAQIDRTTSTNDDVWQFPSTNYTKSFPIPGGGKVTVVFIDTTTLAPSENKCCNSKGYV